jgi:hypothetical protein
MAGRIVGSFNAGSPSGIATKNSGAEAFQFEKLTSYRKKQTVLFLPIRNLGQVDDYHWVQGSPLPKEG